MLKKLLVATSALFILFTGFQLYQFNQDPLYFSSALAAKTQVKYHITIPSDYKNYKEVKYQVEKRTGYKFYVWHKDYHLYTNGAYQAALKIRAKSPYRAYFKPRLPAPSRRTSYFPVPGGRFSNDWNAPRAGGFRRHKGNDIFARTGTPILALYAGRIEAQGRTGVGGYRIWLNTGKYGRWYFAHNLPKYPKRTGQYVKAGETIGYVDSSGNAKYTSPHAHTGLQYIRGRWVNPYYILRRLQK